MESGQLGLVVTSDCSARQSAWFYHIGVCEMNSHVFGIGIAKQVFQIHWVGGNNGVNVYLVPVKAVAELAEAMEQLLVDPALRVTMGMRAG